MAAQLSFTLESDTDRRFREFDREHPEVMLELVRRAEMVWNRGFRHYSIKTLFEIVRWHFHLEYGPGEEFKLNNNYHSRYARKIMQEHTKFAGFFETRELRS